MSPRPEIILELSVTDPEAATRMLCEVFGFAEQAGVLRLGGQGVVLRRGDGGHGVIDHLALAVPDVDTALRGMLACGAVLDAGVTPDGPREIAEFWQSGVRYVFLQGPDGARIELCGRLGPVPARALGHDHIGVACSDVAASRAFFAGLGLQVLAEVALVRDGGVTPVCFMGLGDSVVELYGPPGFTPPTGPSKWQRLLMTGTSGRDELTGPDGIRVGFMD